VAAVKSLVAVHHRLKTKTIGNICASCRTQSGGELRIAAQSYKGGRQMVRSAHGDEQAGISVFDGVEISANRCRNRWQTAREPFHQCIGEAFLVRWQNCDVARSSEIGCIGSFTATDKMLGYAKRRRLGVKRCALAVVAPQEHHTPIRGERRRGARKRREQISMTFISNEIGNHDDGKSSATETELGTSRRSYGGIDRRGDKNAISDDSNLGRIAAFPDKLGRHRRGIAEKRKRAPVNRTLDAAEAGIGSTIVRERTATDHPAALTCEFAGNAAQNGRLGKKKMNKIGPEIADAASETPDCRRYPCGPRRASHRALNRHSYCGNFGLKGSAPLHDMKMHIESARDQSR
jgi:hypothetical protein